MFGTVAGVARADGCVRRMSTALVRVRREYEYAAGARYVVASDGTPGVRVQPRRGQAALLPRARQRRRQGGASTSAPWP
eukprot:8594637-Alexandrium_andersonii.AAC.1